MQRSLKHKMPAQVKSISCSLLAKGERQQHLYAAWSVVHSPPGVTDLLFHFNSNVSVGHVTKVDNKQ